MICKECQPIEGFREDDTRLYFDGIELCPRHSLTERLAEALREYAGLDAACPPRIQKLLQKYDSIVEGEKV